MTDEELIQAFEAGELDHFPHAEHVHVTWCYLQRYPLLEALTRFSVALRHFAAVKGKPDRYHETITIAYVLLIVERLAHDRDLPWADFAGRHPDLLLWKPSILSRYYSEQMLSSDRAREVFVLPDCPE